MKIAVEIPHYPHGLRGSSQYAANLVRALGAAAPDDEIVAFNYFHGDHAGRRARLDALASRNVRVVVPRWPQRLVALAERGLGYPWVDRRFLAPHAIDVFHDAGGHPVDARRTASVFTLHGTGLSATGMDPYFEQRILPELRRRSRVLAHCLTVQDFLIKYYGFPRSRIALVYFGIDHSVFRPIKDRAALDAVRRRHCLPERFLLSVGPFQFRDNVEHVLTLLREEGDAEPLKGLGLVLAGGLDEHGPRLVETVRGLGLEGRVRFTGNVSHEDLAALYSMAEVLVHSSYYEELSTATREAAACGTPIVCSDGAGARECTGDGALYFNPHVLDDLKAPLYRLLREPALRGELRGKAVAWAARFTWEKTARETLEVYRAAARER